jgi:serine/threonine protein kinase
MYAGHSVSLYSISTVPPDTEKQVITAIPNGQLILVEKRDTSEHFAMKKFQKSKMIQLRNPKADWKTEIEFGLRISSPYVVKVFEGYEDSTFGYVITEYCSNGTLSSYLEQCKSRNQTIMEKVGPFLAFCL